MHARIQAMVNKRITYCTPNIIFHINNDPFLLVLCLR